MKFGDITLDAAVGAILAHAVAAGDRTFGKGHRLDQADVAALRAAGVGRVTAARLEDGDLHEDAAAARLAAAIAGDGISIGTASTGRVNLHAAVAGLVAIDRRRVDAFNAVDEAVTVATLPACAVVEPKQMIATIKIMPFAVADSIVDVCEGATRGETPMIAVRPFRPRRVGLVQTRLPTTRDKVLDKTTRVMTARLESLGSELAGERRCAHQPDQVAKALDVLRREGCDLLLVMGASSITDRRDVVPAAIERAGGVVEHYGMPVDPGNLLLLGQWDDLPVIGVPGCARSPKTNGFDWVLQRLCADLPVGGAEVSAMGVGGLLQEIPSRPAPRAAADEPPARPSPRIATLILAAGPDLPEDGPKAVAETVRAASEVGAEPVLVVVGERGAALRAALADSGPTIIDNPDPEAGISTSLKRGIASLPTDADAVIVCLAETASVSAPMLKTLIAAFDPAARRAICLPAARFRHRHPILIARRFFAEIQELSGDVGARALIAAYPDLVHRVDIDGPAEPSSSAGP